MDLLMVDESGHLLPTSVLLPRAAPPLTGSPPFRGLGRTTCCLSSCLVTLLLHLGMLLKMANPRTPGPELVNPRHQVHLVPPSGSVSLASSSARESGCCGVRCFLGIPGGSRSRIVKSYLAMSGLGEAVEDFRAATCRFGNELFLPVGPESFK